MLFIKAKIWKESKCPFIDEWIKKIVVHIYSGIPPLSRKKNGILTFASTWMDLEGIMLSEISQRNTNTEQYHLYVESKGNCIKP